MAETKESYSSYGLEYVYKNASLIKTLAEQYGMSAEAIAGTIAEERGAFSDRLASIAASINLTVIEFLGFIVDNITGRDNPLSHEMLAYQKMLYDNEGSEKNILHLSNWFMMHVPLGASGCKMGTMIDLLKNYLNTIRQPDGSLDLSQDKFGLAKYEHRYDLLLADLLEDDSVSTQIKEFVDPYLYEDFEPDHSILVKFTMLMLEEARNFFSTDARTALTWALLDEDQQYSLMITYFNMGREAIRGGIDSVWNNIWQNSDPHKITLYGLDGSGREYTFPAYFPQPGAGDIGGQMYLDDKASLCDALSIPFQGDQEPPEAFYNLCRLFLRKELIDGAGLNLNRVMELYKKFITLGSVHTLENILEIAEKEWSCTGAAITDDVDNVYFVNNYSDQHASEGNDIIIGFYDRGNILDGGNGHDEIFGGQLNDILTGDAGDDNLYGGAGNDILYGGTGINVLMGGQGADEYHIGEGMDIIIDEDHNGALFYNGIQLSALYKDNALANVYKDDNGLVYQQFFKTMYIYNPEGRLIAVLNDFSFTDNTRAPGNNFGLTVANEGADLFPIPLFKLPGVLPGTGGDVYHTVTSNASQEGQYVGIKTGIRHDLVTGGRGNEVMDLDDGNDMGNGALGNDLIYFAEEQGYFYKKSA